MHGSYPMFCRSKKLEEGRERKKSVIVGYEGEELKSYLIKICNKDRLFTKAVQQQHNDHNIGTTEALSLATGSDMIL